MKRLLLILVATFTLPSCGTVALRLGRDPKPTAPDMAVLRELVCRGTKEAIAEAREIVALRGGSVADELELVERARMQNADRSDCCPTTGCAAPPQGGK